MQISWFPARFLRHPKPGQTLHRPSRWSTWPRRHASSAGLPLPLFFLFCQKTTKTTKTTTQKRAVVAVVALQRDARAGRLATCGRRACAAGPIPAPAAARRPGAARPVLWFKPVCVQPPVGSELTCVLRRSSSSSAACSSCGRTHFCFNQPAVAGATVRHFPSPEKRPSFTFPAQKHLPDFPHETRHRRLRQNLHQTIFFCLFADLLMQNGRLHRSARCLKREREREDRQLAISNLFCFVVSALSE